jgi:tetrapyrrole methylase family protein/MazG family protein
VNTDSQSSNAIERLRSIVAKLRAPDGCPWDREQTHQSLKPHLLEECYELIDAIDAQDPAELKEELGDILLQVVLHSQMASEEGHFTFDEVAETVSDKLVHRHPHVFGENRLPDSAAVLLQWDKIKRTEKQERKSALDGVPKALPALAKAQKVQTKANRVGFDWDDAEGAFAKIGEELREMEFASEETLPEEVGDLLFAVVNFARKKNLDAEQLLNVATAKFSERFLAIEKLASDRGLDFASLGLEQMDVLWEEVKKR